MTQISMDPEVMAAHATMHEDVVTLIADKLNAIPSAVDGGIASDTVAAIMLRIGTSVDALYRIHGTLGEIVRAIADDASTYEEDVLEQLTPIAAEVGEL